MKTKAMLAVLLFLGLAALVQADVSPEKRTEIDRMVKATGMEKLVEQIVAQTIANLRGAMQEVPPEFWDKFGQKVQGSELLELLVPLYDKYYSLEDLRAVNAFYSSEAGQRMIKSLPQLMNESMAIGQEWGQKVGEQAAREVMAERNAQGDPKRELAH